MTITDSEVLFLLSFSHFYSALFLLSWVFYKFDTVLTACFCDDNFPVNNPTTDCILNMSESNRALNNTNIVLFFLFIHIYYETHLYSLTGLSVIS